MPPAAKAPPPSIRGLAAGLFCTGWLALTACAADDCRIAYDMDSSGVRAGTGKAVATPGMDIDALADVVADGRIPARADACSEETRDSDKRRDISMIVIVYCLNNHNSIEQFIEAA